MLFHITLSTHAQLSWVTRFDKSDENRINFLQTTSGRFFSAGPHIFSKTFPTLRLRKSWTYVQKISSIFI